MAILAAQPVATQRVIFAAKMLLNRAFSIL
jgi:hypothetical protein